jgi:hypothetical protein
MNGYLEGYFDEVKMRWDQWFFRTVQCEFILYGFRCGRFFNRQYQSEAAFRKAIEKAGAWMKLAPVQSAQPDR